MEKALSYSTGVILSLVFPTLGVRTGVAERAKVAVVILGEVYGEIVASEKKVS